MLAVIRRKKWLTCTLAVLIAAVSLWVGFNLGSRADQAIGPVGTVVSLRFDRAGGSELVVPLLGKIDAKTHAFPLKLSVQVSEFSLDKVIAWADKPADGKALEKELTGQAWSGIRGAAIQGILLAAFLALSGTFLLTGSKRLALVSTGLTVAASLTVLAFVGTTFNPAALHQATYTGSLAKGREVVGILQARVNGVESLKNEVKKTAKLLANYYRVPQALSSDDLSGTYRILVVSDLHLDPIGFELTEDLANEFKARAVLDVGDINNYGTSIEARALQKLFVPFRPYYFVPGNHDSPPIVDEVRKIPGVSVLAHSIVETEGIEIYGIEDPASKIYNIAPQDNAAARVGREALAAAKTGREALDAFGLVVSGEGTPNIVAAHSPLAAEAFAGSVDVVVEGHTHQPKIVQEKGTWIINPGTTGGVALTPDQPHYPHTAAVLYYSKELPRRLIAIDLIAVSGLDNQSSITRRVVEPVP